MPQEDEAALGAELFETVRRARAAGTRLVTTAPAAKRMTPPARVSWRVNRESSPPVSP